MGTTPLGAVIVGALAQSLGARSGLVLGAIAATVTGAVGLFVVERRREQENLSTVLERP
jgi:hypothetical protein